MTALGVLVQIVWPLMVGAAVISYFNRCAARIDERADQVEATADEVDAIAQDLRGTLRKVRRDAKTISGWMDAAEARRQRDRVEDPPTAEMPRPMPLTRDQRIRSEGAAARPPRHRRREPDDAN